MQIKNAETQNCLDTLSRKSGEKVGMSFCHGLGGNQVGIRFCKAMLVSCLDRMLNSMNTRKSFSESGIQSKCRIRSCARTLLIFMETRSGSKTE